MSELRLNTDGHIIKFGADNDVSLTHVEDAGLLLNSTMKLQFNDASQFVQGTSATVLSIGATDEIDLTATAIDINGTLDVSGTSQFNAAVTLAGTTPTLTIGDAGAEDSKIVFDGNAQDFHIGLDDTDDSLKIGLGSTLGTTAHIIADASGAITTPLNPGYVAHVNSEITNVTGDETNYTIQMSADIVDRNADHAHATGIFTAPVVGLYNFSCALSLGGIAANHTRLILTGTSSNRTYFVNTQLIDDLDSSGSLGINASITVDMDASDTFFWTLRIDGGSAVVDLQDTSRISGFLIG